MITVKLDPMQRLTTDECQEVITNVITTPLVRLQLDLQSERSNDCRVAMVSRDFKLIQDDSTQLEKIYSVELDGVIAGINFHYLYMEINPNWETKIRTDRNYGLALASLCGTIPDALTVRLCNPPIQVSDVVKTLGNHGFTVRKVTEIWVPF